MDKVECVKRTGEPWVINFGQVGEPGRIASVIGTTRHWLDRGLDPSRFMPNDKTDPEPWRTRLGLAAWPKGEKVQVEAMVIKPDLVFENYAAIKEFVDGLKGPYGHPLPFPCLSHLDLWADDLEALGIKRVVTTDLNSLWRGWGDDLHMAFFDCRPERHGIDSDAIDTKWFPDTGILVGTLIVGVSSA